MRTIKFRGKSIETNEWVYGFYYEVPAPLKCVGKREEPKGYIIKERPNSVNDWGMPIQMVAIEVDRNTICQFTGMVDKNNKEIYEADILHVITVSMCGTDEYELDEYNTDVKWEDYAFVIKGDSKEVDYYDTWLGAYDNPLCPQVEFEVVGDIYDNSELVGGK